MVDLDQAEQQFTGAVADALAATADEFAEAVSSATELTAAAFRVSSIAGMWRKRVRPLVRRLLGISETAARAAADDAGTDLPDGWNDLPRRWDDGELPASMGQYAQTTESLLNAVGGRLAEAARRELAAGLDAGEDVDQLRDRMRAAFSREGTQLGPGREERIAVTEAGRAWNTATLAAARASSTPDQQLMKTWAARNDARVRRAHRRADGQTRPLDEPFTVGGVPMQAPGDPDAPSTLTVGCRCRLRITAQQRTAAFDSQPSSPSEISSTRETTMGVDTTVDTVTAAASASEHTGAMIALVPSQEDAKRLALDGGEDADELHLTLAYLGEADEWTEDQRRELTDLVRSHTAILDTPIRAQAFGAAHWNPASETPAWVWSVSDDREAQEGAPDGVQPPSLEDAHRAVLAALEDRHGPEIPAQHTPWQPHVTAVYSADRDMLPTLEERIGPVALDRIRVGFAGEYTDIPLDGKGSDAAAAALTASQATARRNLMASALSQAIASSGEWTPPADWFEAPDGPAGELISLDGRVQGYVARWADIDGTQMCHAGYAADGDCEPVPRGGDYSYFHQGNVELALDDGSRVHPGLLTMDIGHGPGDPTVDGQIAHYDNPKAIAAAVVVGEDDTGIWMSGAVLPEVMRDPDRFTRLRLTPVSGHWSVTRPGGPMELIAVTAVNHPGFPQRTESGSYELAASLGADAPLALRLEAGVAALTERIDRLLEHTASAAEVPDAEEAAQDGEDDDVAPAEESSDAPEPPEGVDRELAAAALRLIEDGDVTAMTAAALAPHGVELPQCLTVLAEWLEGTGVPSQQSRAASVKAAEAICRSTERQHTAVRARACRLISEYRAKGGK